MNLDPKQFFYFSYYIERDTTLTISYSDNKPEQYNFYFINMIQIYWQIEALVIDYTMNQLIKKTFFEFHFIDGMLVHFVVSLIFVTKFFSFFESYC